MTKLIAAFLLGAIWAAGPLAAQSAADTGLIELRSVDPSIRLAPDAGPIRLRRSAAEALARVSRRLATGGVGLEVLAGAGGSGSHRSGLAVDLRLVDLSRGTRLPMGSEYSSADGPDTATVGGREARYRGLLSKIMTEEGFAGDGKRWWHYELGH